MPNVPNPIKGVGAPVLFISVAAAKGDPDELETTLVNVFPI